MVDVFMALLSFRGFDTPSLSAQGEQRRFTYFNIGRDIPRVAESAWIRLWAMRKSWIVVTVITPHPFVSVRVAATALSGARSVSVMTKTKTSERFIGGFVRE
jgi:hypothetical protein